MQAASALNTFNMLHRCLLPSETWWFQYPATVMIQTCRPTASRNTCTQWMLCDQVRDVRAGSRIQKLRIRSSGRWALSYFGHRSSTRTISAARPIRHSAQNGISGSSNWFVHVCLPTQQLSPLQTKHHQTRFPQSSKNALLSFWKTYFLWKACEHGHTPSSSRLQNSSKHTAHVCWKEKMKPGQMLQ